MTRVLIVGGGSGGTMLANQLARRFDVTLLSGSEDHMFQPGLLYVAFKNASPAPLLRKERKLLSRRVRFVQDTVTRVRFTDRIAETASGGRYEYDEIVLATGVRTDVEQIPGLAEVNARFGDYHSSVAQARKLSAALQAFQGGTIVIGQSTPIIKCPPSPIEGALLAEEYLRKKGLREKTRMVFISPFPRAYPARPMNDVIEPIMKERGIEIMPFFDVDRIDAAARTITSIEGDTVQYDLPILVPPFVGVPIAYEPAVTDANGFVMTDKQTLRVQGVEHAFALGDGTNVPTSKAGVAAHLEAKVVARALRGEDAAFDGRTNCPVDLAYGRGTFVIGSYTAPVVKLPPTYVSHLMKLMMARIYWLSLRGFLEPIFDAYFAITTPELLSEEYP